MPIRGKIDRIDQHESTGAWRIIDYKTSEGGASPHKSHHGRERLDDPSITEWLDLQLPLYAHLAQQNGIVGDISLAYFLLPKNADHTALKFAEWTKEHLATAIECAQDVVIGIRAGEFDLNSSYSSYFDDYAYICQATSFTEDSLIAVAEEGEASS